MNQQKTIWRGKFKRPEYKPGDFVQITDRTTGIAKFVQYQKEARQ